MDEFNIIFIESCLEILKDFIQTFTMLLKLLFHAFSLTISSLPNFQFCLDISKTLLNGFDIQDGSQTILRFYKFRESFLQFINRKSEFHIFMFLFFLCRIGDTSPLFFTLSTVAASISKISRGKMKVLMGTLSM